MSKSFKNSIATIAAFEGFANMLCDLAPDDPKFQDLKKRIRPASKLAQFFCMGSITMKEYKIIETRIKHHVSKFFSHDEFMDLISYLSFSIIGLDSVVNHFKDVGKTRNKNIQKIEAFEKLIKLGIEMLQIFDPEMDQIDKYEQAALARKEWEILFGAI